MLQHRAEICFSTSVCARQNDHSDIAKLYAFHKSLVAPHQSISGLIPYFYGWSSAVV